MYIDIALIMLYLVFLVFVFHIKNKEGKVNKMNHYLKRPFGKFLSAVMCGLELIKISLFFFGNLYYIAQFQYEEYPRECTLAYTLMKY